LISHPLSMVTKEDSLNPSFDDHSCSHLFHTDLRVITGSS
jgi:hypothetical protein